MRYFSGLVFSVVALTFAVGRVSAEPGMPTKIDFNRDIRPILFNNCIRCHGPDEKERKGGKDGLRLDVLSDATADLGGYAAIVPGKPEASELIKRITSTDPDEVMPPTKGGKKLSPREVALFQQWIKEGAKFSAHWAYVRPVSPVIPAVKNSAWAKNDIDRLLLARLEREGLAPMPEADRITLIRRLSLDLTGLPPTLAEVDEFAKDQRPDAYEQLVARLLKKDAYGEHWARMWLDLARYADSAGYADDPPRTIWGYRDYVIRSFNSNKPFDQFTTEQIAGDLLPNPTNEQLVATAFHRNTLTNNEGGTNDEEYRNVAIVDRVNTTWAVWMGTSMACSQCHTHKYDPLTQEEYFRFFAILNNTEDADRGDESPLIKWYSGDQEKQKSNWEAELAALETKLKTPTPELAAAQAKWEAELGAEFTWHAPKPAAIKSKEGVELTIIGENQILAKRGAETDIFTVELPLTLTKLSALTLETLPHESLPGKGAGFGGGNFVLSRVAATIVPPETSRPSGRYVRIELPGQGRMLSLAEVQIFKGSENLATAGEAKQSTTDYDGPAKLAIDGNTNGDYNAAKSTTHTAVSENPWWEVDLKSAKEIDRVMIWNRTDGNVGNRLANFQVSLLDEQRKPVWTRTIADPPSPSASLSLSGSRDVPFKQVVADHSQPSFDAATLLAPKGAGWAVGGALDKPHTLTLLTGAPVDVPAGSKLVVSLEQTSSHTNHTLGSFRLSISDDARAERLIKVPAAILAALKTPAANRSDEQKKLISEHYLGVVAEGLKAEREKIAALKKQIAEIKPVTVPIFRELKEGQRRATKIQYRGNFLDLGPEVKPGTPAVFPPLPEGPADRLAMARWLVSPENPLTARVIVNRYWEQIFGIGLVRTSEEFGSQGELPSHPELLDYLATELVASKWDLKHLLTLMVSSAAYRQNSKVSPELAERDPDNRLLARGPRHRLSAEMVRDQALAVSGLLSAKMYGPSVRPPRPSFGLSAAFGGGLDWQPSMGEDKFRRGLYTEWRRTSPYPSMSTFDAPSREVCTIRRNKTNTPLQALVTLNDPVYIEAAQALARKLAAHTGSTADRATLGFRLCVSRAPSEKELARLVKLFEDSKADFAKDAAAATKMATEPLGAAPAGMDVSELAAWTVVSNVLLNLDETLMKR